MKTQKQIDDTPRDFFVETEIQSIIQKSNHVDYISDVVGSERCVIDQENVRCKNPWLK